MLKVNGIDVYYGKVQALFDVSIEVGDNEIVSIIGANGAGKTTLMNRRRGPLSTTDRLSAACLPTRWWAIRSCMCRRGVKYFPT